MNKVNLKVNLEVEFCGVKFINPFLLASAPGSDSREMMARAFEAGWGGAVLKTLSCDSEPMDLVSPKIGGVSYDNRRLMGMVNIDLITERKLEVCLNDIKDLKVRYPKHIVVSSIMASREADWKEIAILSQNAGADMIECNFSCPHGMPERKMGALIGQDPEMTSSISRWVKEAVDIPVLIKLTPNVTDIVPLAREVVNAGFDGITLINTIRSLLGVDLENWDPMPNVGGKSTYGGYSGPAVKPIALRFVSTVAKHFGLPVSASGGITTWRDAAEFILCGAGTVQLCTAPMHYGYRMIEDLAEGLSDYLESKGLNRLQDLVGRVLPKLVTYEELDKNHSMAAKIDKKACRKEGLCYLACRDGGHQAIELDRDNYPIVNQDKCVGCGLCSTVCPVENCIAYHKADGHHKDKRAEARPSSFVRI